RKVLGTTGSAGATGTLNIESKPAGARVLVDNEMRGVTPLSLALSPGSHMIELHGGAEPRTVPVMITAGAQTSQYIELPTSVTAADGALPAGTEPPGAAATVGPAPPLATPAATEVAPLSGWLSLAAPVELQIYENKKLLGTTGSDRIMVASGRHELEIVNVP